MTLALIREHQLAQINNGALIAALVLEALVATDLLGHDAAVRIASRFVTDLRDAEGVGGVLALSEFDVGASYGRAIGTVRDLDAARVRIEADRDYAAEFWRIIEANAVRADRFAKGGGRETVMASAEASGRSWRRVSDGNPCSFCAMLVSRGDAYTSEDAALTVVGRGTEVRSGKARRGGQAKGRRPRGSRGLGEKYHDHCGCTAVEVIGTWTPTAEEQRYQDAYWAATKACDADGVPRTASNVMKRMREGGGFTDSPTSKMQTGGGGGAKPPRSRPVRGGADEPEWERRQRALRSETNGERLEPHEIEFLERFEELGHSALWIPRDRVTFRSTNDFI